MRKLILIILFLVSILGYSQETHTDAVWYAYNTIRKSANGETFNNMGLTAAHKTIPFGTKVKVTNLANNKSVIVRITDRGPFHKSRDLDLAKGAFLMIAKLSQGVIRVKYEILK